MKMNSNNCFASKIYGWSFYTMFKCIHQVNRSYIMKYSQKMPAQNYLYKKQIYPITCQLKGDRN